MKVAKSKLVIFSVAVAFVSVFFFAYAIQAVYPSPQYKNLCNVTQKPPISVDNAISCRASGGQWQNYDKEISTNENRGWCNLNFKCQSEYESVRKVYERNVFFANLAIGISVFIIAFFLGLEAVSSGLMGGAVMLIIYGSIRYWGELNNAWRSLMLGVALAILIWVGYKKLK